jgi:hypothetical protein
MTFPMECVMQPETRPSLASGTPAQERFLLKPLDCTAAVQTYKVVVVVLREEDELLEQNALLMIISKPPLIAYLLTSTPFVEAGTLSFFAEVA